MGLNKPIFSGANEMKSSFGFKKCVANGEAAYSFSSGRFHTSLLSMTCQTSDGHEYSGPLSGYVSDNIDNIYGLVPEKNEKKPVVFSGREVTLIVTGGVLAPR